MNGLHSPALRIAGRNIGRGFPCFLIAEIGTGHNGDPERAEELIDAAAGAGADCVKTQAVFAREILHPDAGLIDLPGGRISLYERFRRLEKDIDFYLDVKEKTERRGMVFLCAPFGPVSAAMLKEMHVDAVKIASPELNYYPLLSASSFGVPLILSTGVSTLADIERAVRFVEGPCALLHCVTSYPAPVEEYNLRCIESLERIFGVPVGISDHSENPVLAPLGAIRWGASIVEKHFTLRKGGPGLDDAFALDPAGFTEMAGAVRSLEGKKPEEIDGFLVERCGENAVSMAYGDGVKRLSPSEQAHYETTNRSLLAMEDLPAGEKLTTDNTALLRSEKNLKPGLKPEYYNTVLGKKLVRAVPGGTGITWKDLLL